MLFFLAGKLVKFIKPVPVGGIVKDINETANHSLDTHNFTCNALSSSHYFLFLLYIPSDVNFFFFIYLFTGRKNLSFGGRYLFSSSHTYVLLSSHLIAQPVQVKHKVKQVLLLSVYAVE